MDRNVKSVTTHSTLTNEWFGVVAHPARQPCARKGT